MAPAPRDPKLSRAKTAVKNQSAGVAHLRAKLHALGDASLAFHAAAVDVSHAVRGLAGSTQCVDAAARALELAEQADAAIPKRLVPLFGAHVVKSVDEWLAGHARTVDLLDRCDEPWKTYAHYTDKVDALETKLAKLREKGRGLSKAEAEKRDRNYAKLDLIETAYEAQTALA
jgi:hypothetical protein